MMQVSAREGDRVGVILSVNAQKSELKWLGYGLFKGFAIPPGRNDYQAKIELETGRIVWSHEVFYCGPEDLVSRSLQAWKDDDWKIVLVDLDDVDLPVKEQEASLTHSA